MTYTQEITLDLNANSNYPIINAKQNDTDTRQLLIHYIKDGQEYLVNTDHSVALRLRKPDNFVVFNDGVINNDGTVTITLTYQCLAAAGRAYGDIVEFNAQGQMLSTQPIVLNIVPAPNVMNQEAISSNEFLYLKSFIDRGNEEIAKAQAWANGYMGDDPVTTDHPAYHNNAKYWADQVGNVIQEAKDGAHLEVKEAEAWAVGTKDGVEISSEEQQYHNNSKYWAEQAEEHSNNAHSEEQKIENMTATCSKLLPGENAKVTKTEKDGVINLHFDIPQGQKGDADFVTFDVDYEHGMLYMAKLGAKTENLDFSINDNGFLQVGVKA